MKQIQISTFTYKGQDFDVLVKKNELSYIFELYGDRYGNAVKITGRAKQDVVNASVALLLNLIDTYDAAITKGK